MDAVIDIIAATDSEEHACMRIMSKHNSVGTLQLLKVATCGLAVLDSFISSGEVLLTRCRVVRGSCLEGTCATKVPVIPAHCPAAPVYPAPMVVHIIPAHSDIIAPLTTKQLILLITIVNTTTAVVVITVITRVTMVIMKMVMTKMWLYHISSAFG